MNMRRAYKPEKWACRTLSMRDELKATTEREEGRHLSPRLVAKVGEGKSSYDLSWIVKNEQKKSGVYRWSNTRYRIRLSSSLV